MSVIPIIASAADIPGAIRHAERNVGSRWYVAKRAEALGVGDRVPKEWGITAGAAPSNSGNRGLPRRHVRGGMGGMTAAGFETLHPRDRKGRFIEKFDLINVFSVAGGTQVAYRGIAQDAYEGADGKMRIRVKRDDKDGGGLIDVKVDQIESAPPSKARLDGGDNPTLEDAAATAPKSIVKRPADHKDLGAANPTGSNGDAPAWTPAPGKSAVMRPYSGNTPVMVHITDQADDGTFTVELDVQPGKEISDVKADRLSPRSTATDAPAPADGGAGGKPTSQMTLADARSTAESYYEETGGADETGMSFDDWLAESGDHIDADPNNPDDLPLNEVTEALLVLAGEMKPKPEPSADPAAGSDVDLDSLDAGQVIELSDIPSPSTFTKLADGKWQRDGSPQVWESDKLTSLGKGITVKPAADAPADGEDPEYLEALAIAEDHSMGAWDVDGEDRKAIQDIADSEGVDFEKLQTAAYSLQSGDGGDGLPEGDDASSGGPASDVADDGGFDAWSTQFSQELADLAEQDGTDVPDMSEIDPADLQSDFDSGLSPANAALKYAELGDGGGDPRVAELSAARQDDEYATDVTLSDSDDSLTSLPAVSDIAAQLTSAYKTSDDLPLDDDGEFDPFLALEDLDIPHDGDDNEAITLLADRVAKAKAFAFDSEGGYDEEPHGADMGLGYVEPASQIQITDDGALDTDSIAALEPLRDLIDVDRDPGSAFSGLNEYQMGSLKDAIDDYTEDPESVSGWQRDTLDILVPYAIEHDVDPIDMIDTRQQIASMGWALEEQLRNVLNGESVYEQNSNAINEIADTLTYLRYQPVVDGVESPELGEFASVIRDTANSTPDGQFGDGLIALPDGVDGFERVKSLVEDLNDRGVDGLQPAYDMLDDYGGNWAERDALIKALDSVVVDESKYPGLGQALDDAQQALRDEDVNDPSVDPQGLYKAKGPEGLSDGPGSTVMEVVDAKLDATGQVTPQAKSIATMLTTSSKNKGIPLDRARVDAIFRASDHEQGHKDMAKVMTELKLGGKQRKRIRELLDGHYGVPAGDDSSAKVQAAEVAASLPDDNPVKEKLAAKAGMKAAPGFTNSSGSSVDAPAEGTGSLESTFDAAIKKNGLTAETVKTPASDLEEGDWVNVGFGGILQVVRGDDGDLQFSNGKPLQDKDYPVLQPEGKAGAKPTFEEINGPKHADLVTPDGTDQFGRVKHAPMTDEQIAEAKARAKGPDGRAVKVETTGDNPFAAHSTSMLEGFANGSRGNGPWYGGPNVTGPWGTRADAIVEFERRKQVQRDRAKDRRAAKKAEPPAPAPPAPAPAAADSASPLDSIPPTGEPFAWSGANGEVVQVYPDGSVRRNVGGGVWKKLPKGDANAVIADWLDERRSGGDAGKVADDAPDPDVDLKSMSPADVEALLDSEAKAGRYDTPFYTRVREQWKVNKRAALLRGEGSPETVESKYAGPIRAGDIITYEDRVEGPRRMLVEEVTQDVKNGSPGFSGVIVDVNNNPITAPWGGEEGKWGYSEQATNVLQKAPMPPADAGPAGKA